MERRYSNRPAKIEARADGKEYIVGHGIVFYRDGDSSTEYELWNKNGKRAVERVDPDFGNRARRERHDVRGLVNHDPNILLGRTSSGTMTITRDEVGERYDILYNENDTDHRNTKERLARGDLDGSSFSFTATARWETLEDGTEVRWLIDGDLFDMGPVTFPAYGGTSAGMRAAGDIKDIEAERDAWANQNTERRRMQIEMQQFAMKFSE